MDRLVPGCTGAATNCTLTSWRPPNPALFPRCPEQPLAFTVSCLAAGRGDQRGNGFRWRSRRRHWPLLDGVVRDRSAYFSLHLTNKLAGWFICDGAAKPQSDAELGAEPDTGIEAGCSPATRAAEVAP